MSNVGKRCQFCLQFYLFAYLICYIYFLHYSLDVYNLKEDAAAFAGKRALISFLSWLDFCDQLIKEAQKVIMKAKYPLDHSFPNVFGS